MRPQRIVYPDDVDRLILHMADSEWVDLRKLVQPGKMEKVVDYIKGLIDLGWDKKQGWEIHFNSRYTHLQKLIWNQQQS